MPRCRHGQTAHVRVCDDRRPMASPATDWFLTAEQRGNPASRIDAGRGAIAWTTGNGVEVHVDGVAYFDALRHRLVSARSRDRILVAGLEADAHLDLGAGGRPAPPPVQLLRRGGAGQGPGRRSPPHY